MDRPTLHTLIPGGSANAPSITRIRLLEGAQPRLFWSSTSGGESGPLRYKTSISCAQLSDRDPPVLGPSVGVYDLPQLLPPPPAWDVAPAGTDQWAVVREEAGGAINRLLLKSPGGETDVSAHYRFESFALPRFIGGLGDPQPSGIVACTDKRRVVVFTRAQGAFAAYVDLAEGDAGLLLSLRDGYLLLSKKDVSGPSSAAGVLPGVLHFVRLNRDFTPASATVQPLGETHVHEFDADLFRDRIVVLYTTGDGAALAAGHVTFPFRLTVTLPLRSSRFLSSPTLCGAKTHVHAALLESAQKPDAAVRAARIGASLLP